MKAIKAQKVKLKAKRTFMKKGTCSRTFFHILNRENGYPMEDEEHAIDPLAGGIAQQGFQCGMLWGAAMGAGAEAFRRFESTDKAMEQTIVATQVIMRSFEKTAKSIECADIASCDWQNKISFAKYMLSGKFLYCFKLAGKWAPDAIDAANGGLSLALKSNTSTTLSCASEVIKKMGGNEQQQILVSGFAGGLGLSGNGCGALSAAIWMKTLARVKQGEYKYTTSDKELEKVLDTFYKETDYEMECHKICGKKFDSVEEHSEFVKNGGCDKLINVLVAS